MLRKMPRTWIFFIRTSESSFFPTICRFHFIPTIAYSVLVRSFVERLFTCVELYLPIECFPIHGTIATMIDWLIECCFVSEIKIKPGKDYKVKMSLFIVVQHWVHIKSWSSGDGDLCHEKSAYYKGSFSSPPPPRVSHPRVSEGLDVFLVEMPRWHTSSGISGKYTRAKNEWVKVLPWFSRTFGQKIIGKVQLEWR